MAMHLFLCFSVIHFIFYFCVCACGVTSITVCREARLVISNSNSTHHANRPTCCSEFGRDSTLFSTLSFADVPACEVSVGMLLRRSMHVITGVTYTPVGSIPLRSTVPLCFACCAACLDERGELRRTIVRHLQLLYR